MLWFFFFKQKTAYEMRISDWSSDVCSSDLVTRTDLGHLKDNIRTKREKARKSYTIRYVVHFGNAFWALFRERGTVRQPPRPWAGPTFERLQMQLLNTMLDTLRKRTTAAARRVARQQKRSRIGRSEEHPSEIQT